jgi:hypothetical protein
MSIASNNNKSMLWDIIKDYEYTKLLNKTDRKKILMFLENQCNLNKNNKNSNLKTLNQQILLNIKNKINNFIKSKNTKENPFQKKKDFELKLKQQQENFSNLMYGKKPNEIDFTDNADETINNMDYLINQTMSDREKDLELITNRYQNNDNAKKWLNNEEDDIVKLNIHDDINLEKNMKVNTIKKKVTFDLDNENDDNEVSIDNLKNIIKLSMGDVNKNFIDTNIVTNEIFNKKFDKFSSEILSILDTLVTNQNIILKIIGKNKTELKGPSIFKTNNND